jgi:hypothetical protein
MVPSFLSPSRLAMTSSILQLSDPMNWSIPHYFQCWTGLASPPFQNVFILADITPCKSLWLLLFCLLWWFIFFLLVPIYESIPQGKIYISSHSFSSNYHPCLYYPLKKMPSTILTSLENSSPTFLQAYCCHLFVDSLI